MNTSVTKGGTVLTEMCQLEAIEIVKEFGLQGLVNRIF